MFHRANVVAIILGLGGVTVGSMSHIFTPTQSNDGASRVRDQWMAMSLTVHRRW